jgi:hypothetical protein
MDLRYCILCHHQSEKASMPNLSAAIASLWLFAYAMAIAGRCHTGGAFMFELEHGCDTAIKSL